MYVRPKPDLSRSIRIAPDLSFSQQDVGNEMGNGKHCSLTKRQWFFSKEMLEHLRDLVRMLL